MALPRCSVALLLLLACFALAPPAFAAKRVYVVYMGSHSHGPNPTLEDIGRARASHRQFLSSYLGSHEEAKDVIINSYKRHINGFSALLDEQQAAEIAKHPSVVSVFSSKANKLHTTRSWDFLFEENGSGAVNNSLLLHKAKFGEDIIIANLDSGVWPESKSFSGHGYGPIPKRWKGACKGGPGFKCNRKLIGAKFFNKEYLSDVGKLNASSEATTRDVQGHGSHTLSTAGGNHVPDANLEGLGLGTARGGSPRARVAAYKVCWPMDHNEDHGGCHDSDILQAFDHAISDGVDVISASVGSDVTIPYFNDSIAIGAFHAARKGILVVAAAGNEGPSPQTVSNTAPWIFTVAASTSDRDFRSFVELRNGLTLKGESASKPLGGDRFYPLITGAQAKLSNISAEYADHCLPNTLDPGKVRGKIVACVTDGETSRTNKGVVLLQNGAKGLILVNSKDGGDDINADPHVLPASHLTYSDGVKLYAYINSTERPLAYLTTPETVIHTKPAPFMASFSSVGPNKVTPEILKPDIAAPGVNILAAYSEGVSLTSEDEDHRRAPFKTMSGTSMACPHVAGVVGLLKAVYPRWSPAAIRSAIMTTAQTKDNTNHPIRHGSFALATPFHYGSGHIRPESAVDPGLVYDTTTNDYLRFLCAIGYNDTTLKPFLGGATFRCREKYTLRDFNYPSISVPHLRPGKTITVIRRVTNVGAPGTYAVVVKRPQGVWVWVQPPLLRFERAGERKSFNVTIRAERGCKGYVFGGLTWSDGKHQVWSPIAVNAQA